jgi:hypothetical protein
MWTGTAKPFKLEVASNKDCDERPDLFAGSLEVTSWTVTVRDEPATFGTHDGKFNWVVGADKASGVLSGTWGCGTHRRAPLDDCEKCRARNHIEGLLTGDVTEGPLKGSRIRASYAGALDPQQVTQTHFPATIRVALDGVYIVPCP